MIAERKGSLIGAGIFVFGLTVGAYGFNETRNVIPAEHLLLEF